MAFDSLWLSATIEEIKPILLLSRILKVHQPDKHTVLLRLRCQHNEDRTLLLSAHPQQARLQLTQNSFTNPQKPPVFCQILRKYLENGKITAIRQIPWERVTEITVQSRNEIGDPVQLYLMSEIMGKHSNLLLVERKGGERIILDGIRRYSHALSRYREVLPGRPYLSPPPQKANPAG